MFNRKSSYALNKKDPNAIVYMDANEAIIRLTREDFASEEEFLKWKSLSDADYHASEKEDHVYANHSHSFRHDLSSWHISLLKYTMRSPLVVLGSFVMDSWWLNFTTPRCT